MKGMLVGNSKGDKPGRGSSFFFLPLRDNMILMMMSHTLNVATVIS